MRYLCSSFMKVLCDEKIRFNENQRLINIVTDEELRLNFDRDGQQVIFKQQQSSIVTTTSQLSESSDTHVIIVESQYVTLDFENSIVFITLYDDETVRHDIIDVKMNEKHK